MSQGLSEQVRTEIEKEMAGTQTSRAAAAAIVEILVLHKSEIGRIQELIEDGSNAVDLTVSEIFDEYPDNDFDDEDFDDDLDDEEDGDEIPA